VQVLESAKGLESILKETKENQEKDTNIQVLES
jgi:hypothetical protein